MKRILTALAVCAILTSAVYAEARKFFVIVVLDVSTNFPEGMNVPTAYLAKKGLHFDRKDKPIGDTYVFSRLTDCEAKLMKALKFTPDTKSKSLSPENTTVALYIETGFERLRYQCEEVRHTPLETD